MSFSILFVMHGSWFVLRCEEFQAASLVSCATLASDPDLQEAAEIAEKKASASSCRSGLGILGCGFAALCSLRLNPVR